MTDFADLSEVVNRRTGGNSGTPEAIAYFKDARVGASAAAATVASRWTSLWLYNGCPGAPTSAPGGTVRIPDNTTAGGLLQADPGGGRQKWLAGISATPSALGTLVLYDRLLDISGFSGTSTSPQTVGGTLTRNTTGVGNEIWVEIHTQIGTSATTITADYTDDAGNSSQTSTAVAIGATGNREAQRMIPLMLASGDRGVQAVASVTLAATTGTAGDFGVVVMRRILEIPCPVSGVSYSRNLVRDLPGFQEIVTDACLAFAWFANGTTAPTLFGTVSSVER